MFSGQKIQVGKLLFCTVYNHMIRVLGPDTQEFQLETISGDNNDLSKFNDKDHCSQKTGLLVLPGSKMIQVPPEMILQPPLKLYPPN